jgi:hypothetical protein
MALAACGVRYTIVTPTKWKPAVGIHAGADKEASRQRVLQSVSRSSREPRAQEGSRSGRCDVAGLLLGMKLSAC